MGRVTTTMGGGLVAWCSAHSRVPGKCRVRNGRAFEGDYAAAFEDAVEYGLGEVSAVQRSAPALDALVGGKEHRGAADMAVGDEMEEDVGVEAADTEVADFVDDGDSDLDIGLAGGSEASAAGEVVDEGSEAVLDGPPVDGEVGLAAAARAGERMPSLPLRG